jgi:glycosyltransferase involved in cell wall biosynthesis/transposase
MNSQSQEKADQRIRDAGRVLMISGSFPPMQCGVGDSAHELAGALASKGVDISVLTDKSARPVGIGDGPFPIHAEVENWGLSGIKKLVKLVERENPDILHVHYPTKAYGKGLAIPFLPMLIRTRRRPYRIVLTLHEFRLSHPIRRLASFIMIDPSDAIVMPCILELNALRRRHISIDEKISAAIPVGPVGPSPDSIPESARSELRSQVRDELGFSSDDVVLIHYGTPTRSKGLEVLFKALRLLKIEGEQPQLLIVGDCRLQDEAFHNLITGQPSGLGVKNQVHWLGRVSEEKLAGIFSAADIGVFPFLDGFSFRRSSLVGVLMWDIPIVTTEPDGELTDLIGQDKVRFVTRNDPRALATGLMPLVANKKALEHAKSVPNPLKELFQWDSIADQYIDIYKLAREDKKSRLDGTVEKVVTRKYNRKMQGRNNNQSEVETIVGLHNYIPDDHILKKIGMVLKTGWVHELTKEKYSVESGRPSIDPEAALRLMLSGFLLGIVHDRELMRRAQTDIAIRWICGYKLSDRLPDHSSLTRIRQRWGEELFKEMFHQVVRMCVEAGIVDGSTIHVDSSIVRANASIESMVDEHIVRVIEENEDDEDDAGKPARGGRRRNKSKNPKRSLSDPDAVMSRKSNRDKYIPGYKGHLAVDDRCGVIVDAIVTAGNVNEGTQLIGQMERVEGNTGIEVEKVTADAQYATSANFRDLEEIGIEAVIPAQPERAKGTRIPARRFKYDAKHDIAVCPTGKKLRRTRQVDEGCVYSAKNSDCRKCRLRERCLYAGNRSRKLYIADGHPSLLRARRKKNRWKEECAETYTRHRWMIEGRIAEAKLCHGMARAVRRGLSNLNIQLLLTAMAIDLKRLAALHFMPLTDLSTMILSLLSSRLARRLNFQFNTCVASPYS